MIGPALDERSGEPGIAGDITAAFVDGEVVDAAAVDFDDRESDESSERFQPTQHQKNLTDIGAKHLITIKITN